MQLDIPGVSGNASGYVLAGEPLGLSRALSSPAPVSLAAVAGSSSEEGLLSDSPAPYSRPGVEAEVFQSTSGSLVDMQAHFETCNFTWCYNWSLEHFNVTLEDVEDEDVYLPRAILAGIILGTIVLMTIVGNVLVLLAVFVNSHLRSTTNYFIVNLAIADLLLGTCVLPFSASLEVVNFWAFGQLFCDIWAAVDVLCCTASIMSLCVISIDRYIGVTRPLQHSTILTEKRALYIIILVWVIAIAISIAPLLGWKDPPSDDPTMCEVTKQLGYVLFSVSGSFYIPLAIILVVYFRVYREALSQSRFLTTGVKTSKMDEASCEVTLRIHTGRPSNPNKPTYQSSSSSEHSEGSSKKNNSKMTLAGKIAKFKREKKAAKTLGIVVGVFIMCWFPFFFILPLESLCHQCRIPEWLFKIIFWLGYCNSMMNPIIYAMSSREFKRAFTRILKCQWRRRPRSFVADHLPGGPHPGTEMNKLPRFSSVRRFTKRDKTSDVRNSRYNSSAGQFLLQSANGRRRLERESPIASLRLLHSQQRQLTMDSVVSDEESAIHGDLSDSDHSENEPTETGALMDMKMRSTNLDDSCDFRSSAKKKQEKERNKKLKKKSFRRYNIPDIVIDDACTEALAVDFNNRTNQGEPSDSLANSLVGTDDMAYQSKDDNIMWL